MAPLNLTKVPSKLLKPLWMQFRTLSLLLEQGENAIESLLKVLQHISPSMYEVSRGIRPWLVILVACIPFFKKGYTLWTGIRGVSFQHFRYTAVVAKNDELYDEVCKMANALSTARSSHQVLAKLATRQTTSVYSRLILEDFQSMYPQPIVQVQPAKAKTNKELSFAPSADGGANAVQIFKYKGKSFELRAHEQKLGQYGDVVPEKFSRLEISCWSLSIKPLRDFLEDVKAKYQASMAAKTTVYTFTRGQWSKGVSKPIRSVDTIVLPKEVKDKLITDAVSFMAPKTRAVYADLGCPYQRGYFIYGSPGTGKTSASIALAGHLSLDVYCIDLSDRDLDNRVLEQAFQSLPEHCVMLLEDIDSAGIHREDMVVDLDDEELDATFAQYAAGPTTPAGALADRKHARPHKPHRNPRNRITLSGLLNAIDGVSAKEGRILILTTNDVSSLPDALIRAGRCDVRIEFQKCNREMIEGLFKRMFLRSSTLSDEQKAKIQLQAVHFADAIAEGEFAPAELSAYLMPLRDDAEKALAGVQEFVKGTREFYAKKNLQAQLKQEKKKKKTTAGGKSRNARGKASSSTPELTPASVSSMENAMLDKMPENVRDAIASYQANGILQCPEEDFFATTSFPSGFEDNV